MRRFYRVVSVVPLDPPTLVIGPAVPRSRGFVTLFSEAVGTLARVKVLKRRLEAQHKFGKHTIEEFTVEAGTVVEVDGKTIVVTDRRAGNGDRI